MSKIEIIEPNLNSKPRPTSTDDLYFAVQQGNELGLRAAPFGSVVNEISQKIEINGIDLDPIDPGTILTNGPAGEKRRITPLRPGTYTWGSITFTVAEGETGTLFWNGSSWFLSKQDLPIVNVQDTLSSSSSSQALSANQGRVLNLSKENVHNKELVITDSTDRYPSSSAVIKALGDVKVKTIDSLDSTSSVDPLSANQGRNLNFLKENRENKESILSESDVKFPTSLAVHNAILNKLSDVSFGGVKKNGDVLSAIGKTYYFATPGNYTINGDPVELDAPLTIISYDGSSWSHSAIPVTLDRDFLVFDNMADFKNMTTYYISLFINGDIKGVQLLGYYNRGDMNPVYYSYQSGVEIDDGGGIVVPYEMSNSFFLNTTSFVNYNMFGAGLLDGSEPDDEKIYNAHSFANSKGLNITNCQGTYYLENPTNIPIKTSVDWTGVTFYVNEENNLGTSFYRFVVKPDHEWFDVDLTEAQKASFLSKYRRGNSVFIELSDYKNHLFVMLNENDVCYRNGFEGQTKPKGEIFVIGNGGKMVGDIHFELDDYTSFRAIKLEKPIEIKGGDFQLSGYVGGSGYQGGIIRVERSKVKINQTYFERPSTVHQPVIQNGLIYANRVYDLTLDSVYMDIRSAAGLTSGSYGFNSDYVTELKLVNIDAPASSAFWGFMALNVTRNLKLIDCRLNRIDTHFDVWNLTILRCEVGARAILIGGGGGLLHVEDTKVLSENENNRFISFRADWSASWDGDIYIKNCEHHLGDMNSELTGILWYNISTSFNYNQKLIIAKSIVIEDFNVVSSNNNQSYRTIWFPVNSANANNAVNSRFYFPENITFKNIKVIGRTNGIRLLDIRRGVSYQSTSSYRPSAPIQDTGYYYNTNICIDNVDTNNISECIQINWGFGSENTLRVIPRIFLKNLSTLQCSIGDTTGIIVVENTLVRRFILNPADSSKYFDGKVIFNNCGIAPLTTSNPIAIDLMIPNSSRNLVFNDCVFYKGWRFSWELVTYREWCDAVNGLIVPIREYDSPSSSWIPRRITGVHNNSRLDQGLIDWFGTVEAQPAGIVSVDTNFTNELYRKNRFTDYVPYWSGISARRPENFPTARYGMAYSGFEYYDTTLGKYIKWNGTNWKDGEGNNV